MAHTPLDAYAWPELNWQDWQPTADTLHRWTQIVGKTRLGLTPMQNHWWNVPLYCSARGLGTSPMPAPTAQDAGRTLEIEFDFLAHLLLFRLSDGVHTQLPLRAQSVADFFAEYKAMLVQLGVEVHLNPMPVELKDPVRFDLDTVHRSYDPQAVERFSRVLQLTDAVLKRFSTGFFGKISPVHFFWGSFDLAVTRFNGKRSAGPERLDRMQQEAYSHEVISAGFWPGNGGYGAAAFYCYGAPVPEGLAGSLIPWGAWDSALGEFVLRYDEVRAADDPAALLLDFLEATYAVTADSGGWDRAALDREIATAPAAAARPASDGSGVRR